MSALPPPLPVHNPYAAPLARVDEAPVAELELADRGLRLAAALIDGVLVGGVAIIAAVAIPAIVPANGGEPDPIVMGVVGLLVVGAFLGLLVINLLWLHRYGQTVAKRWLGIRVLRSDGSHCALLRIIFARWFPVTLLGMIPLIGYVVSLVDALMIFRDDRRCLHDLFADTIVVKA